jgi:tetratricopeptide (TPR) repeat protein
MNRLRYFLTIDDAARQKTALVAVTAGFLCGALSQWSGEPFNVSAYSALVTASVVFNLRLWVYCRATKRLPSGMVIGRRTVIRFAAVAAGVFLLSVLPAPKVEAGIINRRLRVLTNSGTLTPETSARIADTLNLAQRWSVPVPPSTLVRVRDAIKSSAVNAPSIEGLSPAADALTAYARNAAMQTTPRETAASMQLSAGIQLIQRANGDPEQLAQGHPAPVDRAAVEAAIAAFTRAIDLSDGDRALRSHALVARSGAYGLLGRFDEAYGDARSAEGLDSTDLFPILLVEGISLATHTTQPSDLRQAARMLGLVATMQAPPDLASFKGLALNTLAEVYYDLGDFEKSRGAALQGLPVSPPYTVGAVYQLLILCNLRLGDYEQALRLAEEYVSRSDDSRSSSWLEAVRNYPNAPQASLSLLEAVREPLRVTARKP